jgi:hypothetical protein
MNEPKRLPRPRLTQHLTAIELRFINLARRHRANYLRLLRRLKSSSHQKNRRSLLVTACALSLIAMCATDVQAGVSTPSHLNEANAGQRAEGVGPAILGYERARFLAPRDSAVAENLRAVREKAGLNVPAIPGWQRPAHWLGFDGWALLGSFALLTLCVVPFRRDSIPWLSRRAVTAIAAGCGVMVVLASSALGLRWNELDRAVIQSVDATVHIAPAASAQSTFVLKAGDLVTAKREHGDFIFVRTLDLRSGWVNKSDLERIIPTTNLSPM